MSQSVATQAEIREKITNKIVTALEAGNIPFWRRPWEARFNYPTNSLTKKRYRGINQLLLMLSGFNSKWWATYKQWEEIGGQVTSNKGVIYD